MNRAEKAGSVLLLTAALVLGACAGIEPAERGAKSTDVATDDPQAVRCLTLYRIDRSEVVDDENIFFYMKDGTVYRNQLPHRCPGLGRERRYMYEPHASQLCDLDTITVLNTAGGGLMQGPSCGLGKFHPVPAEEVETLIELLKRDE